MSRVKIQRTNEPGSTKGNFSLTLAADFDTRDPASVARAAQAVAKIVKLCMGPAEVKKFLAELQSAQFPAEPQDS